MMVPPLSSTSPRLHLTDARSSAISLARMVNAVMESCERCKFPHMQTLCCSWYLSRFSFSVFGSSVFIRIQSCNITASEARLLLVLQTSPITELCACGHDAIMLQPSPNCIVGSEDTHRERTTSANGVADARRPPGTFQGCLGRDATKIESHSIYRLSLSFNGAKERQLPLHSSLGFV